ncbi:histidine--tRNA ligase [Candidatus Saccharibacteria bacterium]|nr:histidine--tRNA ligase [Candidatus Saccharibacteria bacterium]
MTSLSSQPYKGTRDYYPEDKRVQNYIFDTWRHVVERHGYEEYGAPLLEPLDLYAAKSGQELAGEQTYAFEDRGGRTVAIRPEMTPSISRMVAARRQELAYPARLYSIANFMRYERPQRGREREFWQLNLDLFGVDNVRADAEIIQVAYETLKEFGASDDMFEVKINHRALINHIMSDYLNLDAVQSHLMIKLLDRKNKMSPESFKEQAIEIFGEDNMSTDLPKIADLLSVKSIKDLPRALADSEVLSEVIELFNILDKNGVKNAQFDATLMRGLDYYTGMVFEVVDRAPENNRSMFGGGRYDGLVGLFGVEPIPTVGVAPGLSPVTLFLETHKLLPQLKTTIDASIVVLGDAMEGAQKFANQLRSEGVNVEVDISDRKIDKQIKSIVKKQVPFMIFVGEEELKQGLYSLKEVSTAKEEKLSLERIVTRLADRRNRLPSDEIEGLIG